MSDWTIRRVLAWSTEDFKGRGIGTARLDAELLIAEALGLDRVRVYMDLDRPLTTVEREAIRDLVKRRRAREPIAYILGRKGFYGRDFAVDAAVLVLALFALLSRSPFTRRAALCFCVLGSVLRSKREGAPNSALLSG